MGLIELKHVFYTAGIDGAQLAKLTQLRLMNLGLDAAAVRKKFMNTIGKLVDGSWGVEMENPLSGSRPASGSSDAPLSRNGSGNLVLHSTNSSDSLHITTKSSKASAVGLRSTGSHGSLTGPSVSRQSSGNLSVSSQPSSREISPRRPESPTHISPRETPRVPKLIVVCHLADKEASTTLRFYDLHPNLEYLRQLIDVTLEAESMKTQTETSTIVLPTGQGYLPLVDQNQLDSLISEATHNGNAVIRLMVKISSSDKSARDRRSVADMFDAHEFLISQSKPIFIVEAQNLSANPTQGQPNPAKPNVLTQTSYSVLTFSNNSGECSSSTNTRAHSCECRKQTIRQLRRYERAGIPIEKTRRRFGSRRGC